MMDSMYEEDTKHAIDLMDDEAVVWGIKSSPLTFAYENFMYDIVAHTCSQKYMNKQWYNKLAPDLKPFFMVNILVKNVRFRIQQSDMNTMRMSTIYLFVYQVVEGNSVVN